MERLRTRFAPSPTGFLHIGNARTALFSYLLARKTGGEFILRMEDTDRERHQEHAVGEIIEDLRWLGIHWDEGIEIGGLDGPYRQSEKLETYARCIQRLLDEGKAYYAFETAEELEVLRAEAIAQKRGFRYVRPDVLPAAADAEKARAADRPVVVRFLCPGHDVVVKDDAFGEVVTPAEEMEDFIIQKADGWPTFYLANVIDDADMRINYVVRGQEFLGQTWRQVLLREALGLSEPRYCHLPLILDMQGRKLSKRDGDVEVSAFRKAGYLPEVLVNFLALLGWSPSGDREKFTLAELVEAFSVDRIGKANAKFDRAKLVAFNTDAIAAAGEDRLLAALRDYLRLNETAIPAADDQLPARGPRGLWHLIRANKGMRTLADVANKCEVLFVADGAFEYDEKAVEKVLRKNSGAGYVVLTELRAELSQVEWTAEALQSAIEGYCEKSGLGMGKVAQPLRVAVTGSTISPSIYDTLAILGREKALARIDRCLAATQ